MKKYYAIKRGYDKEKNTEVTDQIFTEWTDAKPLVVGYDDARYKGFETEEEAKTWLSVVDRIDAEKRAKKQIDNIKKDIGVDDVLEPSGQEKLYLRDYIGELKETGASKKTAFCKIMNLVYEYIDEIYDK